MWRWAGPAVALMITMVPAQAGVVIHSDPALDFTIALPGGWVARGTTVDAPFLATDGVSGLRCALDVESLDDGQEADLLRQSGEADVRGLLRHWKPAYWFKVWEGEDVVPSIRSTFAAAMPDGWPKAEAEMDLASIAADRPLHAAGRATLTIRNGRLYVLLCYLEADSDAAKNKLWMKARSRAAAVLGRFAVWAQ